MDYPGSKQWKTSSDFLELFPADAALVAAAAEPEPPSLLYVFKYNLKGLIVATHSEVLVIAPQLRT